MNTSRRPLDAEEAALARALRALPNGEPGAQLDAQILAAARSAVQRRSPVRRPWIWSMGTAAAAVLAFGTLLQMQHSGLEPLGETSITLPSRTAEELGPVDERSEEAYGSAPVEGSGEAEDAGAAQLDRIEVSGSRIKAEPMPMAEPAAEMAVPPPAAPPPPPPAPPAAIAPRPQAFPTPKSSAAPEPRPEAPAQPPAPAERKAPVPAPALQRPAPALRTTLQPEPAPLARDVAQPARRERGVTLDQQPSKSAGSAAAVGTESEIDHVAGEKPQTLFRRVRDLLDAGERQHALDLLVAWHRAHPDYPLPDDLRTLLE